MVREVKIRSDSPGSLGPGGKQSEQPERKETPSERAQTGFRETETRAGENRDPRRYGDRGWTCEGWGVDRGGGEGRGL